ncbi:hypothetical protein [Methanoregula sp. UBA64]|jgi:hypothetical protein|uniref:hypothetical protein n=1 Tax=Methanoregula sp. UBA64 TaxID=1915554 RepID=UPI0025DC83DF|nr:hypothetical protein [Methanoregula sp. UBA64]
MKEAFCGNCGAKLDLTASVKCPICGAEYVSPESPKIAEVIPQTTKSRRGLVTAVAVIVIVIIAIAGYYLAESSTNAESHSEYPVTVASGEGQYSTDVTSSIYPSVTTTSYVSSTSSLVSKGTVLPRKANLKTIATFSGTSSRTTNNFYVPSYWELWYTADPKVTGGQDIKGGSSSASAIFPRLSIQVMDGDNPNQVARTIEPPGGLDVTLWKSSGNDPRPWVEKFYAGNKHYYLVINEEFLNSYTIEIRSPNN